MEKEKSKNKEKLDKKKIIKEKKQYQVDGGVDVSNEQKDKKKKEFILKTKTLFITYSRVPSWCTKEYVRNKLIEGIVYKYSNDKLGYKKLQTKVDAYLISEEKHKEAVGEGEYDRGDKHIHCVIQLKRRDKVRGEELEIIGPGGIEVIRGNYQSVNNLVKCIKYTKKEGNYIEEGFMGLGDKNRDLMESVDDVTLDLKLLEKGKLNAKEIKSLWRSIKYRNERDNYEENIRYTITKEIVFHKQFKPYSKIGGVIDSKEFYIIDKITGENIDIARPLGICLYGPPKTGKTMFAESVASYLDSDVFLIVEGEKELCTSYRGEKVILFDEADERLISNNVRLIARLITAKKVHTNPAFVGSVEIGWPRTVVIASNEDVLQWNIWYEKDMLKSRILFVKVKNQEEVEFKMFVGEQIREVIMKRKGNVEEDVANIIEEINNKA